MAAQGGPFFRSKLPFKVRSDELATVCPEECSTSSLSLFMGVGDSGLPAWNMLESALGTGMP